MTFVGQIFSKQLVGRPGNDPGQCLDAGFTVQTPSLEVYRPYILVPSTGIDPVLRVPQTRVLPLHQDGKFWSIERESNPHLLVGSQE